VPPTCSAVEQDAGGPGGAVAVAERRAVVPASYAAGVHRFDAELWLWKPDAAWHFVSLPEDVSDEIGDESGPRQGFGSVPVQVTIGSSTWSTSVFPDSKRGTYVLPVKQQVRSREGIEAGDVVTVELTVREPG
jgi:hypothetical protein